jgi:hypothetical protein
VIAVGVEPTNPEREVRVEDSAAVFVPLSAIYIP